MISRKRSARSSLRVCRKCSPSASPRGVDPRLEFLKRLGPQHGVFASMGNHDGWSASADAVRRRFERAGIPLLINRNSVIRIDGEKLAIAATDHVWLGKPDPRLALRGIPSGVPVLALVHEPDFFDHMSSSRNLLQISGHTHGGQCRVPFFGFAPAKVRYGKNTSKAPSPGENPGSSSPAGSAPLAAACVSPARRRWPC